MASIFSPIFSFFRPKADRRIVRARYDSAQTPNSLKNHWALSDSFSANAANSPEVRKKLRERARYEIGSNSLGAGIVSTLVNDVVGTGPRLQVFTDSEANNDTIEKAWQDYAAEIDLPGKLATCVRAGIVDGEGFALMVNRPGGRSSASIGLKIVECDQCESPFLESLDADHNNGVKLDSVGDPVAYYFSENHPGDYGLTGDYRPIDAAFVLHLFAADRPGQIRGIPEITPALPLFALLRDFTLATVNAAKSAAAYAGVIYTDTPSGGDPASIEALDNISVANNALLTLPEGWRMGQLKAEHPTGTYAEFKHEILNEIARCLNMPYNIAACNSSSYNYASGRLDHQTYDKSVHVRRDRIKRKFLNRLYRAWLAEVNLTANHPCFGLADKVFSVDWYFDGREHVDPTKEANALETNLANHAETLQNHWSRKGRDWRQMLQQRAEETKLIKSLGLPVASESGDKQEVDAPEDGVAAVSARWSGVSLGDASVSAPAASVDLVASRGKPLCRSFRWLSADRSGVVLDGAEISLTARNKSGAVVFSCDDKTGHIERDASSAGVFRVSLTPEQVDSALSAGGVTYSIDAVSGGRVYRLAEGAIVNA